MDRRIHPHLFPLGAGIISSRAGTLSLCPFREAEGVRSQKSGDRERADSSPAAASLRQMDEMDDPGHRQQAAGKTTAKAKTLVPEIDPASIRRLGLRVDSRHSEEITRRLPAVLFGAIYLLGATSAELLGVKRHKFPDAHRRPAGHPLDAVRLPVITTRSMQLAHRQKMPRQMLRQT